jgi:succinate-semialdehyde dehydrogenase/glutarate-semialdehyde dehydrogenase
MMAKKLSAAIAGGCAVVAKPAELTPLSMIALWNLIADEADHPPGRLNLVMGPPAPIGRVMCAHPAVRVISFTGSTEVGRMLMAQSAPQLKRLALELGGNAPFIVMDDADLSRAVDALMASKFRCAGQTCVCANRVYVQRGIAGRFIEAVAERVRKLRVGDGLDPQTDIGPLINRAGFEKAARHVHDALGRGARRIVGEDQSPPEQEWGCFYRPAVLVGLKADMLIAQEETFAPVVAIGEFDTEDEVIDLANATPYGLACYLFTADPGRGQRMLERLHFGHAGLNSGTGPAPEAPFGGMKQSGFGREGGLEGLMEFCETQTIADGS